jgi:hypothetical protein
MTAQASTAPRCARRPVRERRAVRAGLWAATVLVVRTCWRQLLFATVALAGGVLTALGYSGCRTPDSVYPLLYVPARAHAPVAPLPACSAAALANARRRSLGLFHFITPFVLTPAWGYAFTCRRSPGWLPLDAQAEDGWTPVTTAQGAAPHTPLTLSLNESPYVEQAPPERRDRSGYGSFTEALEPPSEGAQSDDDDLSSEGSVADGDQLP